MPPTTEPPHTASTAGDPPGIIGLDHLYLSVSDLPAAERFYDPVMRALGFRKGTAPIAGEAHAHYICPALQLSLRPARSEIPHDPYAPGLHHLCLQARDSKTVDQMHAALVQLGVVVTAPAHYPEYNPDYYAIFFTDPDGLRLEVVARTPSRDAVARDWPSYRHFLNPRAALDGERQGVFHLATDADWQRAQAAGAYRPASLADEGFIHCSVRAQVLPTAARFYAGRSDLWLLRIDAPRLADALRYEGPIPADPALVDALFPHLYAELPLDAVLDATRLTLDEGGAFRWPADL